VDSARSRRGFRSFGECNVDQRPIIYAFILPGLVVYQILRRKRGAPSAWSGWWPWIFSLGIFLVWAIGGIVNQPAFTKVCR
jgi:hypothetical protein